VVIVPTGYNEERAESGHPTIYTVAERAGVSIATVSRAVANSPSVRPRTRERVRQAARELGWQAPHERPAREGATRTLALVFHDIDGPFYLEVVRAVEFAAAERGYHVTILAAGARRGQASAVELVGKVDGMIVMPTALSDEEIGRLQRRVVPLVLVNHAARQPGPGVDTILTMNREGAYQATDHLLSHGYGRVALIAGPVDSTEAHEREEGYRQALTRYALPFDDTLVVRGDFRQPGGYAAMNRLLAIPTPPRAVFVANDEMAFGALEAIKGRGLRIPEDVAVAGFDDIPLAAHLRPALTTVRQPLKDVARLAVERLLARLAGDRAAPETMALLATLVLRRSCGCGTADHA